MLSFPQFCSTLCSLDLLKKPDSFRLSEALSIANNGENEQGGGQEPLVDVSFLDAAANMDKEIEDFDDESNAGKKDGDDNIDSVGLDFSPQVSILVR